jgi:hypothetical protein
MIKYFSISSEINIVSVIFLDSSFFFRDSEEYLLSISARLPFSPLKGYNLRGELS